MLYDKTKRLGEKTVVKKTGLSILILSVLVGVSFGLFFEQYGENKIASSPDALFKKLAVQFDVSDLDDLYTKILAVKINNDALELGLDSPVKKIQLKQNLKLNMFDEAFSHGFYALLYKPVNKFLFGFCYKA